MNTSEAIKKARKDAGITQAELAERLGITPQMISQYERGSKKPSFETAEKIFNALGIDEWEIYDNGRLFYHKKVLGTARRNSSDELTPYLRTLRGEGAGPAAKEIPNSNLRGCSLKLEPGSLLSETIEAISRASRLSETDAVTAQFYQLMQDFNKLNHIGREKALERVHELTEVPRYTFPAVTPAPASAAEGAQTAPQSPAGDTDTPKGD